MKTPKASTWMVLALAWIGCGLLFAWRPIAQAGAEYHEPSPSAEAPSPPSESRASGTASTERPAIRPSSANPVHPRLTSLGAALQAATDWRAFALEASAHPESGGYLYAMHAANLCSRAISQRADLSRRSIEATVGRTGTIDSSVLAALQRFTSRCAAFSGDEADALFDTLRQQALDRRDPLFNAVQHLRSAAATHDAAAIESALKDVLGLKDRMALSEGDSLVIALAALKRARGDDGMWFAGKQYRDDDPAESSSMAVALALASCTDQSPCSLDDDMLLSCLGTAVCTLSREAYLRAKFGSGGVLTEAQLQAAVALSVRIREALGTPDMRAFARPG